MSAMEDLYKKSNSQHIKEARAIPSTPPNFIDPEHRALKQFKLFDRQGDPTQFTNDALKTFDKQVKGLIQPTNSSAQLMQWTPEKPYFKTGDPK